jgi:HEAT repeat protein
MRLAAAGCLFALMLTQAPPSTAVTASQLKTAIDSLGKFDDAVRTSASATVRRAPAAQAVPALVAAASEHADGYVRFRALVLLSGFNDPRARDVMLSALDEPNDRLRTVAYNYFEHNPEPGMGDRLLAALDKEESEFVRPALTRALAAYGTEPKVRAAMNGLVMKGQDLFRSAVIEALGDYKAEYAVPAITAVSKLDGPLQEDAILALGKIGDKRSLPTLASLQQSAPKNLQPEIAAAICLLGTNCDLHQRYIVESLTFASKNLGYQELLRSSAKALGALAQEGHADAVGALIDFGVPAHDPVRSPLALAFGTVALRNTPLVLKVLQSRTDLDQSALLLRDAFDMLEEDFAEERFFATVRRAYWQASAGSPERRVTQALIKTLEF